MDFSVFGPTGEGYHCLGGNDDQINLVSGGISFVIANDSTLENPDTVAEGVLEKLLPNPFDLTPRSSPFSSILAPKDCWEKSDADFVVMSPKFRSRPFLAGVRF